MAGLWYRVGTISVTNGSKKITGFGTQWATAVIKPKKGHTVHAPDGRQYELDYVESDTVMHIVTTYAGVTATGQAYAIDITRSDTIPAFSRDLAAFTAYAQGQYDSWQQVLTGTGMVTLTAPDGQQVQVPSLSAFQPTSASLKALQALVPAANQIAYYTSAGAADMTTLSSFARTLLDDADAAAMRTTMAAAPSGYGVGEGSNNITNLTTDPKSRLGGIYRLLGGSAGSPDATLGSGVTLPMDGTPTTGLIHISSNGATIFGGTKAGDGPPSWRMYYNTNNAVGVVSYSNGASTGAVIESGSNANGIYIKWADGSMVCYRSHVADRNMQTAVGALFGEAAHSAYPYAAAFASAPVVMVTAGRAAADATATFAQFQNIGSTTSANIRCMASASSPSMGVSLSIVAYGKWR